MSNIYNKICNICKEINYLEEKIKAGKSEKEKAYFVRKKAFEEFKDYIHYNEISNFLDKQNLKPNLYSIKEYIKKIFKDNKIKKEVNPIKVKNSKDLENYLLYNQRKYYIIHKKLGEMIFDEKEEFQISFKIEKNIIKLYFNEKDILKCEINDGIIDASCLLIQEKSENNNEIKSGELNANKKEENKKVLATDLNLNIENKYKNHFEILIRFFLFSKEKKENKNQLFSNLTETNKDQVFLINNDWFEKFKLFFKYKDLESYLNHKLEKININSNCNDELFEKIISDIPSEIFNNIKQNENIELEKNIDDISLIEYKLKIKEEIVNIKLFNEFQIINTKIFSLLMNLDYNINPIKMDLYFIGNKKLLLRNSNKQMYNVICDEIGLINENNIFIPEYILYYTKITKINSLNFFFKNKFQNGTIIKDSPLEIFEEKNSLIGYCISLIYLNDVKNEDPNDENQNDIKNELFQKEKKDSQSNDENDNENIINDNNLNNEFKKKINSNKFGNLNPYWEKKINKDFFKEKAKIGKFKFNNQKRKIIDNNQISNPVQNKNNYEFNNEDSNGNELESEIKNEINAKIEKEIKDRIEIILLMNNFEKEMNKEIIESANNINYEIKECVLIKKEWVDNFKNIHLNDEIKEYLKNPSSDDIITDVELIYFNQIRNKKIIIKKLKKPK